MPASVCTAMSAWIESSGLISADQPPFGLSPKSATLLIASIFIKDQAKLAAMGEFGKLLDGANAITSLAVLGLMIEMTTSMPQLPSRSSLGEVHRCKTDFRNDCVRGSDGRSKITEGGPSSTILPWSMKITRSATCR